MSLTSSQLRQAFLDFFAEQGHKVVPSSSLVPHNDPTLLFTNAGMVQFKDCFLGKDKRDYVRAASSQRCVRAGGKHNDLENVGYTARHHTFFEMLGNFSFGDYFKKDAIRFAWDFVTGTLKIDAKRLMVTVYHTDDEAYDLWHKMIGLPADKIVRIGDKPDGTSDNFWQMGDTGPCGPCSEIFYDHGPQIRGRSAGLSRCRRRSLGRDLESRVHAVRPVGRRQAHAVAKAVRRHGRGARAHRRPCCKASPTTTTSTCSSNSSEAAASLLGTNDYKNPSLRVIADHIRACSFLVVDGVIPSNEGRGYVLRRIARRAMRHGYKFGVSPAFFHNLVPDARKGDGPGISRARRERQRSCATCCSRKANSSRARSKQAWRSSKSARIANLGDAHKIPRRQHSRLQAPRHVRVPDRSHGGHRARARPHRRHGRLRAGHGRAAQAVAGREPVRRRSVGGRRDNRR